MKRLLACAPLAVALALASCDGTATAPLFRPSFDAGGGQGVNLHAGTGGSFEVSVNGKQIWSKLETKQYPELKVVTDAVAAVLPA